MSLAIKHHELYKELGSIVGSKYVSDDLGVLLSYTRDISAFPAAKPQGVVVRPGSVKEVVELVRLANQTRTPLIPAGGKNSYSGVAPGQPGRGIVVDMRRMNKVLEIDEVNMAVTVEAGIHLGEMLSRVNERGWGVHGALMPHYGDTVGGQLSGYAGGGWGQYGPSVGFNGHHYLLGLKVVLPDGSVVDTGSGEGGISSYRGHTFTKLMHGPDFAGIFTCDSGMFGIKVEATYRMFRPPKFQEEGVRYWDSPDGPNEVLNELWEIDPHLYMQPYARFIVLSPKIPGSSEEIWFLHWLSLGDSEEELKLKFKKVEAACAKHGAKVPPPALAGSMIDRLGVHQNWEVGKLANMGQMPFFELVVSKRDLLECIKWASEYLDNLMLKMSERGLDVSNIPLNRSFLPAGPEGIGIIAVTPFYKQDDKEVSKMVYEGFLEFLEQAHRRGYEFDGMHNNGSNYKARFWTPQYYAFVSTLKKTLDPNNIMNPGVYSF